MTKQGQLRGTSTSGNSGTNNCNFQGIFISFAKWKKATLSIYTLKRQAC